jgi:hypothetical protein
MSQENENSEESIKQKIEIQKEKLKLLNSFYLPILSGQALMVVNVSPVPSWKRAIFFLVGWIILGFIYLETKKVLKEIDSLIKKL